MNKARTLLAELMRYKNGIVSDSMKEKGINYRRNYGVAVSDIKLITNRYTPNHILALELFEIGIRETMLAAIYLENPEEVNLEQMLLWSTKFNNSEIVEHASILFSKTPFVWNFASECFKSSTLFLHKMGWLILGRIPLCKLPENFDQILVELIQSADISNNHIQRAMIYALPNLSMKEEKFKSVVLSQLKDLGGKDSYLESELRSFLF